MTRLTHWLTDNPQWQWKKHTDFPSVLNTGRASECTLRLSFSAKHLVYPFQYWNRVILLLVINTRFLGSSETKRKKSLFKLLHIPNYTLNTFMLPLSKLYWSSGGCTNPASTIMFWFLQNNFNRPGQMLQHWSWQWMILRLFYELVN